MTSLIIWLLIKNLGGDKWGSRALKKYLYWVLMEENKLEEKEMKGKLRNSNNQERH